MVDDDAGVARSLSLLVAQLAPDAITSVAHSAADGIARLRDEPLVGMIVDMKLGDGLGTEVIEQVRAVRPETRVLAISGNRVFATRVAILGVPFAEKPLDTEVLLAFLRSSLSRWAAQRRHLSGAVERIAIRCALTPAESVVLYHLALGRTTARISKRLMTSARTTEDHVAAIRRKLAVRTQLAAVARVLAELSVTAPSSRA